MFIKNLIHKTIGAMLFAAVLVSCGTDNENPETLSDENPEEITFKERNDWSKTKAERDALQYDKNYYTYIVEPGVSAVPVVEAEDESPQKVKASNKTQEEQAEVEADPYISESQTVEMDLNATRVELRDNRPPLYDQECLGAQFPVKCSNEKIEAYIKANLDYPGDALEEDHDGLEFVLFNVNTEGEVENISVRSKDKPCEGCAKAARKVVANMPSKWIPALRDGKAVNVKVALPVSFDAGE